MISLRLQLVLQCGNGYTGSDSLAFQGLTILAGMMLSLGSNTVVSNKMSGLFVIYRSSTKRADFATNHELNAYTTKDDELPKILSDLHRSIVAVFNENSTQIMIPFYTGDPEVPKLPYHEWNGRLAHENNLRQWSKNEQIPPGNQKTVWGVRDRSMYVWPSDL